MKQLTFVCICVAASLAAQETSGDRVTVPFSDPSKPRVLKVNLLNGAVTVRGYDGKDAIIEARGDTRNRRQRTRPDGLRRLEVVATGLLVEEQNNTVTVGTRMHEDTRVTIQVPHETSLFLRVTNGDDIVVENISGEVDAHNTNGGIKMSNISGNVVAHALNDNVIVTFDKVTPNKPMSFSSLNGDIDVTLPADVKARVKLKSNHGDIYTDFEIQMEPSSRQPTVEDNRGKGGKYRVNFDRAFYGSINGGGPELQFTTFNGKILVRKGK
jgi:hypothetical protein